MKPVQTQGAGPDPVFDLIGDRTPIKPPEWLVENSFDGSVQTVATPFADAARRGELDSYVADILARPVADFPPPRPPGRRPPNKSRRHG